MLDSAHPPPKRGKGSKTISSISTSDSSNASVLASPALPTNVQTKVRRECGFSYPFSKDQIITWILQPIVWFLFTSMGVMYLSGRLKFIIITPYIALIFAVVSFCIKCCKVDPSDHKVLILSYGFTIPFKPTRHCSICHKASAGLDHHCTWLNTCIAENNYGPFICLLLAASVQVILQTVTIICLATIWYDDILTQKCGDSRSSSNCDPPPRAAFWFFSVVSICQAGAYVSLLGFHLYLIYVQKCGTYDWLLKRKEARDARLQNADWNKRPTELLNTSSSENKSTRSASAQKAASSSRLTSEEKLSLKKQWETRYSVKGDDLMADAVAVAAEAGVVISSSVAPIATIPEKPKFRAGSRMFTAYVPGKDKPIVTEAAAAAITTTEVDVENDANTDKTEDNKVEGALEEPAKNNDTVDAAIDITPQE